MPKVKVPAKWKANEVYAYLNMRITTLEVVLASLVPGFKNMMDDTDSIEESGLPEATKAEIKEAIQQLKEQLPGK